MEGKTDTELGMIGYDLEYPIMTRTIHKTLNIMEDYMKRKSLITANYCTQKMCFQLSSILIQAASLRLNLHTSHASEVGGLYFVMTR